MYGTQDMARYRMADRLREADARRMAAEAAPVRRGSRSTRRVGAGIQAAVAALASVVGGASLRPAATTRSH